jgi:hypothetical protein
VTNSRHDEAKGMKSARGVARRSGR